MPLNERIISLSELLQLGEPQRWRDAVDDETPAAPVVLRFDSRVRLVPKPDRRQTADRRAGCRGGRRKTDRWR
jgi:hypothetical protein